MLVFVPYGPRVMDATWLNQMVKHVDWHDGNY